MMFFENKFLKSYDHVYLSPGYNEYVNYPWEDYSNSDYTHKPRLTRATSSRDSG